MNHIYEEIPKESKDFRFSRATIIKIRTQAKVRQVAATRSGDKSCVLENFPENLCLQNFVRCCNKSQKIK